MQANSAGRQIKAINKQIKTEKVRQAMAEVDIALQQKQIAFAQEIDAFLRSKYTNVQLSTWMDNSIKDLFYQTYTLANDMARKAERAFQFDGESTPATSRRRGTGTCRGTGSSQPRPSTWT